MDQTNSERPEVDHEFPARYTMTAFRLNQFKSRDPEVWFAIAERCFELANIRDERVKFNHVLVALDDRGMDEVRDIILRPPEKDEYTVLKKQLLARLTESQASRIRKLLESEELGDRKPSQFLRHLQALAGYDSCNAIIKFMWMKQLPQQIQISVITLGDVTLEKAAEVADAIMEQLSFDQNQTKTCNVTEVKLERLLNIIDTMCTMFTEMAPKFGLSTTTPQPGTQRRPRPPPKPQARQSQSRPRVRAGSPWPREDEMKWCWYHKTFGDKAKRCQESCTWDQGNESESITSATAGCSS